VWGWLPGRGCLGCLWVWAGWGAVLAEKGQLVVSRGCVARGCGWLSVVGIENTPAVVVGRCGCCGRGGLLVVGAPCVVCVCGGWHAVGVLG